jgi:3'(2'), 5'-bisphosphate nucleotidase
MEWDTAAGDAVLRSAGGTVSLPNGQPFNYGKLNYRNGAFIAHGNY